MADLLAKLMNDLENSVPGSSPLPPVDSWNPALSGDIDIRIDHSGKWFHEGTEFQRESLVKLFSNILKKEGGDYYLVTPVEKWRIQVDEVPFMVTRVERLTHDGQQALVFFTSAGDRVVASGANPLRIALGKHGEPRPYLLVRGGMEGLLARSVYYQLAEYVEPGPEKEKAALGVYSLGVFFPLE